ncbi:MAG: ABC transporter ATP-binding protein/permease [Desulfobulbaceae bacterium]|nr:ABC transporter ATP-binding protein/permease [Desulfobulbaceae bacterium]
MRITQRPLFYWILRRYRPLQFLVLIVILASLFFRVFPLEMQKRIINEAIHLRNEQLLFLYCGFYIGAVTLAGLLKYLINTLQTVLGQKILVDMRNELYHHILQLPLQFYRKMQPGTVISAMTAELNAIGFFLGGALAIPITSVLTFLVFVGFMFSLSPLLTLLSLSVYPFELIIIPLLQRRYNRFNKKRIRNTRAMGNLVNEAVSGIHEVHSNSSYDLEEKRMSSYAAALYRILKKLFIVKYGMKFANNMFQSFGPFILFLVGGYLAINGQFTLGALVAFLSAYEKIYDPWHEMLVYYQDYQDAAVRYKQIMKIFNLEPEHPLLPEGRETYRMQGGIELKSAGFSVSGVKLLDNISAKIKPKEQIALVGFSGSGKSTMALLIAQLYQANHGSILLDGKEINTLSKADISKNITMIAQHPFIFTGTIRDNLLYAVKAATKNEDELPDRDLLLQTIRDVGMEEDILRFGFNMIIPKDRVMQLKEKFLRMRLIIQGELGEQFANVVEFYDPHHFLEYCSLRDNIVFGDSLTGEYDTEKLARNKVFMNFIRKEKLDQPLYDLGLAIARRTVNLLKDIGEDEFFFQGSPMEADQLTMFTKMLQDDDARKTMLKHEKDLLLLALSYIPGKHTIIDMPKDLADRIVKARHHFLQQIMGVDIDACFESARQLKEKGLLVPLHLFVEQKDFVAFCPTEYLYRHSLKDNILFGGTIKESADVDRLYEIAMDTFSREGLLDEVLDIGLDFEVGSKGDRLSGGQKQKIAIARALLKDTPILIMDEATAGLDNQSQAMIQNLIETRYKGHKTIIAVIHRLDMTPAYDRIIVLKAGTIIEQGTYEELMARKGAFYELVNKH